MPTGTARIPMTRRYRMRMDLCLMTGGVGRQEEGSVSRDISAWKEGDVLRGLEFSHDPGKDSASGAL